MQKPNIVPPPPLPHPLPTDRRAMLAGIGGLAAGAFLASAANAGPLTPPPGPINPTPGPEPRIPINQTNTPGTANSVFRISQPGSYYLTGKVGADPGKGGILIAASNVTLDLMGFAVLGTPGSFDGIAVESGTRTNITVRNGSVSGWGADGIDLSPSIGSVTGALVEGIHASGNAARGIAAGNSVIVRDCTASQNGNSGISVSRNGVVERCTTINNIGIGINTGSSCTVSNCTSSDNNSHGLSIGSYSTITCCTSHNNDGIGISTFISSTINNCNSSINTSEGISTSTGCAILNCMLGDNGGNGISAAGDCMIIGNSCRSHATAAGIRFSGRDNRVEGNNCTRNATGILASTGGNFIARNICSGNTTQNWNIAAGNACFVVFATFGNAINGDLGGTSPGSTNPNANYTY